MHIHTDILENARCSTTRVGGVPAKLIQDGKKIPEENSAREKLEARKNCKVISLQFFSTFGKMHYERHKAR